MSYAEATRRTSYNYLLAVVLLVLYEASVWIWGRLAPVEGRVINGVDGWFNYFIALIPFGSWVISLGVAVVGLAIVIADRKDGGELHPRYFLFMLAEAAVYAAVLFLAIPYLFSQVFQGSWVVPGAVSAHAQTSWLQNIGLSLGAGFYEELFFRVILVFVLLQLVRLFGGNPKAPGSIAVVLLVSALLFSAVHYIGSMGDKLELYSFLYRFVMGLVFSLLLVLRRFAITAWTHALYDVYVFTAHAL